MRSERIRFAHRLAALESFREEHLRQQLANAHRVAAEASAMLEQREASLTQVEASRERALLGSAASMARYALYGELGVRIAMEVEQAVIARDTAETGVEVAAADWRERRAHRDAADERAKRLTNDALREQEKYQREADLELWLGRKKVGP